ncbi:MULTISPECIES: hypothetical protein [unclassified Lysinibacillus]
MSKQFEFQLSAVGLLVTSYTLGGTLRTELKEQAKDEKYTYY